MRVALVTSLVAPIRAAEANGPHSVVLDLARGLGSRGHDVVVYAARGSVADGLAVREIDVDLAAADAALTADGSRVGADATAALERGFERLFDAVLGDGADVVSQHAFDAPAIRLAEMLPVLHTLHLAPIVPDVVAAARATRRPLATVSAAARDMWLAAGVGGVMVLRNGVPAAAPGGGRVRYVALIAGRVSPEKGTDTAIRVARRARLRPLVVGDIYDKSYYQQRVAPLLQPDEIAEAVSRDDLSRLMAESAVTLMPIEWDEAFGLVAAEAQMAGCPVVGYRRGALPEIVHAGIGGFLVEPGDEDGLVGAARAALELDRQAIKDSAEKHLGVEQMIADYERALGEIASVSAVTAVAGVAVI